MKKTKVLIIGSGGREHVLVWKIAKSPSVEKIYCAPGNGGIASLADCIPIGVMDTEGIIGFVKSNDIGLVVVAPENPLAAGLVDELEKEGIRAFGPHKNAAVIESSKMFSKNLMKKYGIPTAAYEIFSHVDTAIEYLSGVRFPVVIKADGLALGKGVIIAHSYDEAVKAVQEMMSDKVFGSAGDKVIIEEFLTGHEVTVLAFTDGKTIVPMVSAQDHKRAYDNDEGLNTGGMGTFSPSRFYTDEISTLCMEEIFQPTIEAMNKEGRTFKGILYFGLILTAEGPKVIEYNCRFGDPEAQVVLPRLKTDIIEVFNAIIDGRLDSVKIEWEDNAAVCVVMASGGYPGKYKTGLEIVGLEKAGEDPDVVVFHAGTRLEAGKHFTAGGRVLGVTAVADSMDRARDRAYAAVRCISFDDMHYRTDIGIKKD